MSAPRVLLLMPATTYRAGDFIHAALRLGVEVVVGSDQRQTLEEAAPGGTLTLDFRDPEAACRRIVEFARQRPLHAVIGVEDETALPAARASEALDLPHNPFEAVRATRDKHLARQRLKGSGIKVPEFWRFSTSEDPAAASQRVTYPCVLKPTFLSASRGVIRSDDEKEFVVAFERLQHLLDEPAVREKGGDAAGWILVESFIAGTEVALEGLLTQGELKTLALFDKPDPLEGPFFEETLYVTPSRLPAEVQSQIQHSAASTAARLGLREGPVHAELRVNDEGVWPLEMAARSIGGLCSRALRFGAGISLEELILRHALRMDLDAMERERKAAGVMMIPIPRAGILRSFTAESARKVPGVEELVQSIPLGQELLPLPEGSRYLGFIFARAATPAEVEAALREAHGRLEIVIE